MDDGQSWEEEKRKRVSLISQLIITSAHPVSITMNILTGFENYCIWPFSRNAFSDENIKAVSVVCGGGHEPSVLTVWIHHIIYGTSRESLEKKVAPEEVRPYPRAAPSIRRSGGRLKGKLRILTLTLEKECIQDLAAKRRTSGIPNPKPRTRVKTRDTELY